MLEILGICVTRKGISFFSNFTYFFRNRKKGTRDGKGKKIGRGMYGFGCFVKRWDANSLLRKRKCEKFEEDIGG